MPAVNVYDVRVMREKTFPPCRAIILESLPDEIEQVAVEDSVVLARHSQRLYVCHFATVQGIRVLHSLGIEFDGIVIVFLTAPLLYAVGVA